MQRLDKCVTMSIAQHCQPHPMLLVCMLILY